MVKRKRALGNNEQSSAKLAIEYMTGVNKETGEEVFTESDRQKVQEAILLTVPNFDVSLGTVTQPEFVKYKGNLRDREKKNSINKDYWHGLIPRFILAKADNLNYS